MRLKSQLKSKKRKAPDDEEAAGGDGGEGEDEDAGSVTISCLSDLGVERVRTYASPDALAHALVAALSEHEAELAGSGSSRGELGSGVLADARVVEGGCVVLCTAQHLARQRVRQFLHCSVCGGFFNGDRGLRQHQMVNLQIINCCLLRVCKQPLWILYFVET
jgi:hypothetical protein